MKDVDIYLDSFYGGYEEEEWSEWVYYLHYKGAVIKRTGREDGRVPMRLLLLEALKEALNHMTEPCKITVHSKIRLGLERARGSSDKDIMSKIIMGSLRSGHILEFKVDKEFDDVQVWEKKHSAVVNDEVMNDGVSVCKDSESGVEYVSNMFDGAESHVGDIRSSVDIGVRTLEDVEDFG